MTDTHAQCDHCDTYAELHHNEDNIAACGGARLMTSFVATAYKYGIDPELLRVEIARVARLHGREDVAEKVEAIDPTDED